MRFIFYFFLISAGLTLGALILAPSLFDVNNYKSKITEIVNKKINANLKINGFIKLSFFPKINISIEDIVLDRKDSPQLFNAKKVLIYPSLFSIIKGEPRFNKIRIYSAVVNIERDKNGEMNWNSDLIENKDTYIDKFSKDINNKKDDFAVKKNERVNQRFSIKELIVKDSKFLYKSEKKVLEIEDVVFNFREIKPNQYTINGSSFFETKEFKFQHQLNKNKENYALNGKILFYGIELEKFILFKNKPLEANGNIKISSRDLSKIYDSKNFRKLNISASADLMINKNQINLENINILSNKNNLKGKINYKINNRLNQISLFVNSNKIDLNNFFMTKTNDKINNNRENETNSTLKTSSKKLEINYKKIYTNYFNQFQKYDFNFEASINHLIYNKFNVKNFNSKISNKDKIKLSASFTDFYNGSCKVNMLLNNEPIIFMNLNGNNIDLSVFNEFLNQNKFEGSVNLVSKNRLLLEDNRGIIENLIGTSKLSFLEMKLLGVNFTNFSNNLKKIESFKDIRNLKDVLLTGNTNIENFQVDLNYNKGILELPLTSIELDNDKFLLSGQFNLMDKSTNLDMQFDEPKLKLLSLFNINFNGNTDNIKTSLNYNEKNLEKFFQKKAETKIKKIIKDKLEKKFDNIMDNLLN